MKILTLLRGVGLLGLVLILGACAGAGARYSVLGPQAPNMSYNRFISRYAVHPAGGHTWMSPDAKPNNLLYVANLSGTVSVFSWPRLKLVGELTGFQEPSSVCVDSAQDIYVVDFFAKTTYEYAHGGSVPLQSLADSGGYPNACSVDKKTGDLAITNEYGADGGSSAGNLEIYPKGTGTPSVYTDPNIFAYWWPAYDNRGDLFFNGYNSSFSTLYTDELREGRHSLKSITVNQPIGFPGGLLWDGKYLACEDATINVIYQFAISGSNATVVGSTTLGGGASVLGFWVTGRNRSHPEGTTVIGADTNGGNGGAVEVWPYPGGGSSPTATVGTDAPAGLAVSLGRRK